MNCPPLLNIDLEHVLTHVTTWDELRGAHLFITGGTGFFGRWLLETFCHANATLSLKAQATVLSRDPQGFLQDMPHLKARPELHFLRGDVLELGQSTLDTKTTFSHIIHAATATSGQPDALTNFDTIVTGTRRVLDLAVEHGTRRFLLTSSGAVYGVQPPEISHVGEEYSGAPPLNDTHSAYGQGKRAAEFLGRLYFEKYGIETVTARGFAFIGPHLPLDVHFAIGNFLRDARRGGPIQISGDGTPLRSYLYAADLAVWLWELLLRGTGGRAYNLGSESAVSIAATARAVAECFYPAPEIQIAQQAKAGVLPSRYVPSTRRAQEELGLVERIELLEAIRRTNQWLN